MIQVTVDDTLLNEKLSKEEDNTVISILIDNEENFEFTGITGQTIKNMELRNATLEINTGLGSYSIRQNFLI